MHAAAPDADFVIIQPGGFRTEWVPGVIQYQHYYNMIPFDNGLYTFEMTGTELLNTLMVIQSGKKGFYQAWGLQMHVTFDGVNKNFVSAKFMDGSEIDPTATYKGATIEYLINGGDDFAEVIGKIYTPRNLVNIGELRPTLKPYLIDLKTIT